MSLCSLSYLGGVLDRASAILCGSDAVTCPVTGQIITPLPHDIAQLLTSPHLNRNLSICRCRYRFCRRRYRFCCCCYHPFFAFYFHPWKRGLLSAFTRVLLCESRLPILVCFGSHYKYSGSCGVPSVLGWRMAR
jgi:hypothetical protein